MNKPTILEKRKLFVLLIAFELILLALIIRVFYIQTVQGEGLQKRAYEQQTRDRLIAANRGSILDRNMVGIAKTETVASVSVIHNQIKNKEEAARILAEKLELDYDMVLEKVSKKLALERIKTKVPKEIADEIRNLNIPGVVVDEDIKRVYPFSNLAAQVIGFVGKDNQGIIGLEAKYDGYLKGESGKILTETDVKGREVKGGRVFRVEPQNGYNIVTSIDVILQQYAEQTLEKTLMQTNAKRGAIILVNPQNGEIYAMANKPDFDLNSPFTINDQELQMYWDYLTEQERNNALNQMWRNFSINDTYEPGSTFKVFTSVAGLEDRVVKPDDQFVCSGSKVVAGRNIKCWRSPRSHGAETFVQGVYNSCNPVFMEVAERLGSERFYDYLRRFGFDKKTGIDVPGEAVGIMHKLEKVGPVELATMSFGQSFQITPMQLLRGASTVINGGYSVTPHFVTKVLDTEGNIIENLQFEQGEQIISKETSDTMREILEGVVYQGTGNKTYLPGYRVGGKTATSEKLPRKSGKYIASFLAFAPAESPVVVALVLIDEPQGAYYGGMIAGPVMKEIFQNTLPYLGVEPEFSEDELTLPEAMKITIPDFRELDLKGAEKIAKEMGLIPIIDGEGDIVKKQFPMPGDVVNKGTKIILYVTPSENWEE